MQNTSTQKEYTSILFLFGTWGIDLTLNETLKTINRMKEDLGILKEGF